MRTDTQTFRRNVFASVRALGINSRRSKEVASIIASRVRHGSYLDASEEGRSTIDSIDLSLHLRGAHRHQVDVRIDGEFAFAASTRNLVLVDTTATPRQLEIAESLAAICAEIHDLRSGTWEPVLAEDGSPDWSMPSICTVPGLAQDSAPIQALLARHEALQAESIAINPFADVTVLDPELADIHYEVCKDDGYRPSGYRSLHEVRSMLERRERAANDDRAAGEAA